MEIAPRDGGNYIPDLIRYATDVDLVECSIKAAMGMEIDVESFKKPQGFWAYYAVHSSTEGVLDRVWIREDAEKKIIENHLTAKHGDTIKAFTGANATLGVLLMKFDSMEQMLHMMDHSREWIKVILQKNDWVNKDDKNSD